MQKKKVLITRAIEQAGEFASLLEEKGFEPIIFPVIEFVPTNNLSAIKSAIENISSYNWLIFTSTNSVRFFIEALKNIDHLPESLRNLKVCAVGPRTAQTVKEAGIEVTIIPENYQAEGVLAVFREIGIKGQRVIFPRAEKGREILPEGLKELGASVDLIPVYRTIQPEGKSGELLEVLKTGIDVVTFTSGSTVRNFLQMLGDKNIDLIKGAKIACISTITAVIAREHGLEANIIPKENTTASLAEAIETFFQQN